ncbi:MULTISPECIES: helix-turn-helix domain-containing protein [Pseudomonas]|uniref:Helix-turn-helix transcriptional regulator n=1 Tax=Pseudomonas juntendi TaxID=2666183 RepID=A0A7W2KJL9_9PSED|nr:MULTISPECIES: AraC family transcriptional regulator [Pseudomonas]MBA6099758.1 helix-turn-helix transcriptional regulator [Pseudomonas juntendi]PYB88898.1 AraC family transcriptional regulator [Pseudomonas sp. MB-090624]
MNTSNATCRLGLDQPRHRSLSADGRLRLQLDEAYGQCHTDLLQLEQGLSLGRLHYHPTRPLVEETCGPHDGHVMVVTVGLQGKSGFIGQDGSSLAFEAGHTTITAFRATPGERRYQANETASQLRVVIDHATLCKYVGEARATEVLGSGRLHRLDFRPSSQAAQAHAAALVRYLQPGGLDPAHRLDLHIHTLSLLAEQFNLLAPPPSAAAALSTSDVQRIERARNLLCEQLDKPLTVDYLATAVGMNEHKLKEGFRYLFDTTPARMLLELRMRKAMTLLEAGQQVAQAAWQVGYKYPNNFTVAFTRYFGRSPKSIFGRKR